MVAWFVHIFVPLLMNYIYIYYVYAYIYSRLLLVPFCLLLDSLSLYLLHVTWMLCVNGLYLFHFNPFPQLFFYLPKSAYWFSRLDWALVLEYVSDLLLYIESCCLSFTVCRETGLAVILKTDKAVIWCSKLTNFCQFRDNWFHGESYVVSGMGQSILIRFETHSEKSFHQRAESCIIISNCIFVVDNTVSGYVLS